jgi:hypothetical protein
MDLIDNNHGKKSEKPSPNGEMGHIINDHGKKTSEKECHNGKMNPI